MKELGYNTENAIICRKCKEEKLFSSFRKDRSSKNGHSLRCKKCLNVRQKEI